VLPWLPEQMAALAAGTHLMIDVFHNIMNNDKN
jgi:hypothetical protein